MTPNELRAEAAMVDQEEGTDCTTRACLLRAAADEIDGLNDHIEFLLELLEEARTTFAGVSGDDFNQAEAERYDDWLDECDSVLFEPPTPEDD